MTVTNNISWAPNTITLESEGEGLSWCTFFLILKMLLDGMTFSTCPEKVGLSPWKLHIIASQPSDITYDLREVSTLYPSYILARMSHCQRNLNNWCGNEIERERDRGLLEIEARRCHSGQEEVLQIFRRRKVADWHMDCITRLLIKEADAPENLMNFFLSWMAVPLFNFR